jgi:hypothetical protein
MLPQSFTGGFGITENQFALQAGVGERRMSRQ